MGNCYRCTSTVMPLNVPVKKVVVTVHSQGKQTKGFIISNQITICVLHCSILLVEPDYYYYLVCF